MKSILLATTLAAGLVAAPAAAITFAGAAAIPNGVDLSGLPATNGGNILGGFGSDLVRVGTSFYGLTDRGPGGGTIDYAPRIQVFGLQNGANGAASGIQLQRTIVFRRADGSAFTGLNPRAATGNAATLGNSFDPEGLAIRANGNLLVSDEYGPSVYEFTADGVFVRAFAQPQNLLPRDQNGTINYVDGRKTNALPGGTVSGRQDNRGYEGLTLSKDGKTAYAILQDPLVNEGEQGDGRRSRNVRIVSYDVETGAPGKQFIYQLDDRAALNATVTDQFGATAQGRNIGVSSLVTLPDGRLAVLERDNRGWGVEDANAQTQVASKRIYAIDLTGATDVANVSLANTNALGNVVPAAKSATPLLDIRALLATTGVPVVEKMEGFTFSDRLADGGRFLYVISDNDYSVTQNGSNVQFTVCTSGPSAGTSSQVALGAACPAGQFAIPTYLYTFRLDRAEAASVGFAVPEPATWGLMLSGFALVGIGARRRRRRAVAA